MARQDERISCLFLVNMTQVLETVVWSLTVITGLGQKGVDFSRDWKQGARQFAAGFFCLPSIPSSHFLQHFSYHRLVCMRVHSCLTPCSSMQPTRLLCQWDFPGKHTGGGAISCSRGPFQPGREQHLLHWQADPSPLAPPGDPLFLILVTVPNFHLGTISLHSIRSR